MNEDCFESLVAHQSVCESDAVAPGLYLAHGVISHFDSSTLLRSRMWGGCDAENDDGNGGENRSYKDTFCDQDMRLTVVLSLKTTEIRSGALCVTITSTALTTYQPQPEVSNNAKDTRHTTTNHHQLHHHDQLHYYHHHHHHSTITPRYHVAFAL